MKLRIGLFAATESLGTCRRRAGSGSTRLAGRRRRRLTANQLSYRFLTKSVSRRSVGRWVASSRCRRIRSSSRFTNATLLYTSFPALHAAVCGLGDIRQCLLHTRRSVIDAVTSFATISIRRFVADSSYNKLANRSNGLRALLLRARQQLLRVYVQNSKCILY